MERELDERQIPVAGITILSWNLEHMRPAKLERGDNAANFARCVRRAQLAFFYEAKVSCLDAALVCLRRPAQGAARRRILPVWAGGEFRCFGADSEIVVAVWQTAVVSRVAPNKEVQGRVDKALSVGQRPPVILDVTLQNGTVITVGAWHAAGPAVNLARDVFTKVRRIRGIDLLFGDFNWQAPLPLFMPMPLAPPSKKLRPDRNDEVDDPMEMDDDDPLGLLPDRDHPAPRRSRRFDEITHLDEVFPDERGTTTYTRNGPTNRDSELDRCFVGRQFQASVTVSVDRYGDVATMIDLTNHYPLFIRVTRK